MIYGPSDAEVRTQIVLQASLKPLCGAGDASPEGQSQDMGSHLQQAVQSGTGYLSPDKQNSHCFLPTL